MARLVAPFSVFFLLFFFFFFFLLLYQNRCNICIAWG